MTATPPRSPYVQGGTPEDQLTPRAQGVPDNPVRLPPGALACWACGIAVPDADVALTVVPQGRLGRGFVPSIPMTKEMEFGQCPDCRAISRRATELVAAQPLAWLAAKGDAETAAEWVAAGLFGLAALGVADDRVTADTLVRHLARAGAAVRWSGRFFPMIEADARPDSCTHYPWAHVRLGQRRALTQGYARLLESRIAAARPPVALRPPRVVESAFPLAILVQDGCLLCGAASVRKAAAEVAGLGGPIAAAYSVWSHRVVPNTSQLGGESGLEALEGYCCPSCEDAVSLSGTAGFSAMRHAMDVHLRARGLEDLLDTIEIVGWGALYAAARRRGLPVPRPGTPWAHLST